MTGPHPGASAASRARRLGEDAQALARALEREGADRETITTALALTFGAVRILARLNGRPDPMDTPD